MLTRTIKRSFIPVLLLAFLWPSPAGYYILLGFAICLAAIWVLQASHSKYLPQAAYTTVSRKVKYEN